eukprot:264222-Rhodomonas_salina.1
MKRYIRAWVVGIARYFTASVCTGELRIQAKQMTSDLASHAVVQKQNKTKQSKIDQAAPAGSRPVGESTLRPRNSYT